MKSDDEKKKIYEDLPKDVREFVAQQFQQDQEAEKRERQRQLVDDAKDKLEKVKDEVENLTGDLWDDLKGAMSGLLGQRNLEIKTKGTGTSEQLIRPIYKNDKTGEVWESRGPIADWLIPMSNEKRFAAISNKTELEKNEKTKDALKSVEAWKKRYPGATKEGQKN